MHSLLKHRHIHSPLPPCGGNFGEVMQESPMKGKTRGTSPRSDDRNSWRTGRIKLLLLIFFLTPQVTFVTEITQQTARLFFSRNYLVLVAGSRERTKIDDPKTFIRS